MFEIKENLFTKTGIVKYENENNDRIMIIAEKDGSKFTIKIRPHIDVKVEAITLTFPYEVEGLNYQVFNMNEDNMEYVKKILHDGITIAEMWVKIMRNLSTLFSSNVHMLAFIDAGKDMDDKETDIALKNYTEILLNELNEFDEIKEFVVLYKNLIESGNKEFANKLKEA